MNAISNLNFKKAIFSLGKRNFCYLLLLSLTIFGCKRVVREDDKGVAEVDDIEEVSTAEMKKVMDLKLPLKTVLIDKTYNLTIPESNTFSVSKIEPTAGEEAEKIGKIDLAKISAGYFSVTFDNIFTRHEDLYKEEVLIIPENDSKILTIKDIKNQYERADFVYLEDEKSIVFEQSDTFFTIHFDYDEAHKSYIFYRAEMSWSKKFPKKQKVNLFLHLLKQAQNLTNTNYTKVKFTSWEDYVQNSPIIKVDALKGVFKKIEKELKIFLEEGEKVAPRTSGNYEFVQLYRATTVKELAFYKFIDAVKANKVSELDDFDSGDEIFNVKSNGQYKVRQEDGCYVIDFSIKNYSGEVFSSGVTVVCPIEYKGKSFFIRTMKDLTEADSDLFVKMFSYFSKNYTLNIK